MRSKDVCGKIHLSFFDKLVIHIRSKRQEARIVNGSGNGLNAFCGHRIHGEVPVLRFRKIFSDLLEERCDVTSIPIGKSAKSRKEFSRRQTFQSVCDFLESLL